MGRSLELTLKQGKKNLVAKDSKGVELFSGPIDSPEQRASLPPGVRERLEQMEGMHGFSFEPGKDCDGNVMFGRPPGTKIQFRQGADLAPRNDPAMF